MASDVAHDSPPQRARTILIAVDGSPCSRAALNAYYDTLSRPGDAVHVIMVHEMEIVTLPYSYGFGAHAYFPENWIRDIDEGLQRTKKLLIEIGSEVKSRIGAVDLHLKNARDCSIGDVLTRAINEELHPDMVIMGSRGLSTLRRTLLGSVSDFVLRHSHSPVTIVKSTMAVA